MVWHGKIVMAQHPATEYSGATWREQVAQRFGKAAITYESNAVIQARSAELLAQRIKQQGTSLLPGPILEIGCGTGLFTRQLLRIFPDRKIVVSDASQAMLEICRTNIEREMASDRARCKFRHLDGELLVRDKYSAARNEATEQLSADTEQGRAGEIGFACIVANFAFHWFSDLGKALESLSTLLRPGGYIIFSVPGADSFPEWRELCCANGVPFTANPLPSFDDLVNAAGCAGLNVSIKEELLSAPAAPIREVLHSLRLVGASTRKGKGHLSVSQLRKLMRDSREISLSYEVLLVSMRRGF